MRRIELDFLRRKPPVPALSWLLLALGLAAAFTAGWQHTVVQEDVRRESARAAQLARESKAGRPRHIATARAAAVAADLSDQALLGKPWGDLFLRLERSRPAKIAFLDLEADGRKSQIIVTAEAKTPAQMLDYLNELRKQPGFSGVTLTSHVIDEENPQQPVLFVVRLDWSQS